MHNTQIHLVLADDDLDDCLLFKDALEELDVSVQLTTLHDGEELMGVLSKFNNELLMVIFLDLNMPRKNGLECLVEIKKSDKLKDTLVVIFSTSFDPDVANQLYNNGANYYIQKPNEFSKLKKAIFHVLHLADQKNIQQPAKEKFIIQL